MSSYIHRIVSSQIEEAHKYYPVIVITGPRQSGKSTLSRHLFPDYNYVNLEHIATRTAALSDPVRFIDSLGDHVIIDEAQHAPEIMSMIQVRVDENKKLRFILTGSSNFSLLKSITQSLAGRAALFTLLPFSFREMGQEMLEQPIEKLMWDGQYPGVIVNKVPPQVFYRNYYTTYVERDLRDLLNLKNLLAFDKFIRLLASRVGSEFNASALAREVGVTSKTISEWQSLLTTSYITYPLQPYYNNMAKRLTKMSKIYFYDSGLLCYLLSIETPEQLEKHPLKGAVFENMAMGELLKKRLNQGKDPNLYFYRENGGREVDAVSLTSEGKNLYEVKAGKVLRPDFMENMEYLKRTLPDINSISVIFDGQSIPPVCINIREI
ncbi:MAG: ATP-binding protein [Muribaculaceae bacterium]|nr:ATP-binding protein [Muribaculaceae bacterium]